jgi:hypothetical protein
LDEVAPRGGHPRVCGRFPPLKRGALEGAHTWVAWLQRFVGAGFKPALPAHGAGNHPAAYGRHPSQEGNGVGRGLRHPSQEGNLRGQPPPSWAAPPSTEGGFFGLDEGCGRRVPPCPLPGKGVPPQRRGLSPRRARARPFPSWEGTHRVAPGWFPAPCADATNVQTPVSAKRPPAHGAGAGLRPARLCEAAAALAIRTIDTRRSNPGLT